MSERHFHQSLLQYLLGFVAALILSVLAYVVATGEFIEDSTLVMGVLLVLAVVQLIVQLFCFLHLGARGQSRDRTITLGFTISMMLVIVIGSLWIMKNLDYRMGMSSDAMNEYMLEQNKKGF